MGTDVGEERRKHSLVKKTFNEGMKDDRIDVWLIEKGRQFFADELQEFPFVGGEILFPPYIKAGAAHIYP